MSQPVPSSLLHLAARLQPRQADLAFTLARQAFPQLTPPQWRRFVADALAGASQTGPIIYAIEDLRGYIKGLCICQLAVLPPYGRLLDIDPFVVFEIGDRGKLGQSLFLTLEHHARNMSCTAIRIASPVIATTEDTTDDDAPPTLRRRLLAADRVNRAVYAISLD